MNQTYSKRIKNDNLAQLQQCLAPTLSIKGNTDITDASVLIAITNEKKPKVLLTRRASHMNSHAGEVSFPGGKHEIEDGDNITTALRETHEETNLRPDYVEIIGQLETQISKAGLSVRPIVAIVSSIENLKAEEGEIARIFWADFDWLVTAPTEDYEVITQLRIGVSSNVEPIDTRILTPSWIVDGERVWGLTGRIIAELLRVGFNRQISWYYRPMPLSYLDIGR